MKRRFLFAVLAVAIVFPLAIVSVNHAAGWSNGRVSAAHDHGLNLHASRQSNAQRLQPFAGGADTLKFGYNMGIRKPSPSVAQSQSVATSGARKTADVLWYTLPEGNASVQLSTGSSFGIQGNWLTGWGVPDWFGVGDFNGDGKDDLIWYEVWNNAGASVAFSTGSGFAPQGQWFTGFGVPDWATVGDFNGDGKADVLWYETQNNAGVSVLLSTGSSFNLGGQWLTGLARPTWAAAGDFNGDGLDDLIWYLSDGTASIFLSTGNGFAAYGAWLVGFGVPDWAGVGDFNGDGKDDLIWYEVWNNAGASVVFSTGSGFTSQGHWFTGFGVPGWAAVGDVNGDGKADVLWYESWNNAGISVLLSRANGFDLGGQWATQFPIPTRAAVGNFDGDSKFIGGCASWDAASPRLPPTGQYYTFAAPDVWAVLGDYDVAHVLSSVQAIANASAPRLFLLDQAGAHRRWLNELRQPGHPLAGYTETSLATLTDVVNTFRSSIDGAVVWGEDCWATRNAAVTAAGADGRRLIVLRKDTDPNSVYTLMTKPTSQGGLGIPVLIDLTNKFTGSGTIWDTSPALPSTGSKKDDVYYWMVQKYVQTSKANPNLLAYRIDGYWIYKTQRFGPGQCGPVEQCDLGAAYDNDYLISRKAIVFDLDPWNDEIPADDPTQPLGSDYNTFRYLYQEAYNRSDQSKLLKTIGFPPFTLKYSESSPPGPPPWSIKNNHVAWQTEWRTVRIASTYNSYIEADIEGTYNTSFYAWMPRTVYRQALPSGESKNNLYAKGYLSRSTGLVNKKYILLTESDFDAVSWMQGFLVKRSPPHGNERSLWEDPARGALPIAWAFNPQMVDRIPNIFNYVYCTRTNNDYFVGGDSGAGYVNPTYLLETQKGNLPGGAAQVADGVTPWVAHNQTYYRILGDSITNNIINGEADALSQPEVLNRLRDFSPDGTTLLTTWPPAMMRNGMPLVGAAASFDRNGDSDPVTNEANAIKRALADNTKMFYQFRVVLVPPNELVDAVNQAKITYPTLEAVDPYTFFELMKISLGVDIVPPACNFQINGGAATTNSRTVQIGPIVNYVDYAPNRTGVTKLRFSNDRIVWEEFTPGQSIWFTLTAGAGLKTVYMQAQDGAGNWGNSDLPDNYFIATITYSP